MNSSLFFENFELLADAPNSAKILRRLILQLAVRGKLVPQDPNDEPASFLIEKIKADISQNKLQSKIKISCIPYDLPTNWEWVKFGDIVVCRDGERIPVARSERENREKVYDYYGASGVIDKIDSYLFDKPLLLIGEDGANLLNRSTPIAFIAEGKYWVNNHAHVLDGISLDFLRYLEVFINAIDLSPYVTGSAQPKMNQAKMNSIPIAIPPLAEQKRIVSKVDELMALCDKLEARRQKKQELQSKLNSAALEKILSAENQEEFEQYWQRIYENFDLLYDNPENVEKLKQAILKAGVEGKLTQQWRKKYPDVESAKSLLSKIEEKKKISDVKKNRRSKQLRPFNDAELSTLPENWEWTRLDSIADIKGGITKDGKRKVDDGREVPYLRVANVQRGYLDLDEIKYIEASEPIISELSLKYGDVLFTEGGDLDKLGRGWIWQNELPECIHQNHIFRARLHSEKIISKFVSWFANSHYQYFMDEGKQTTNLASINLTKLRGFTLPIPPYEEQKRIVEKVEQLMGLCDELESKLRKESEDSEKLMEAVVKGLLEEVAY